MTDEEKTEGNEEDIVVDKGSSKLSDLWKMEDYWAIWLGFSLLAIGLALFFSLDSGEYKSKIAEANATLQTEADKAPFKSIAWFQALDAKKKVKASGSDIGKQIKELTAKPKKWKANILHALFLSEDASLSQKQAAEEKYQAAKQKEGEALEAAQKQQDLAAAAEFKDELLNKNAVAAISTWRMAGSKTASAKKKTKVKAYNLLPSLLILMLIMAVFFGIGWKVMGHSFLKFILGFTFVFLIAVLAYIASNNATMKHYGIGYAAWAILFGLIISNTVGTPKWVLHAVQTEYYIKTGLVLLGAEILFGKILSIGVPGIFVTWIVTPIVLTATYFFGQKIVKLESKTLNMTISADMSVCGVSAAIATAAACRAKKEELTLAVGLSLVFTSIMMILMPAFIKAVGIPEVLGGAWMGGTIDATGAVAAAGAFLGERALYVAATIKMIQNVLIGVIAFVVAFIWVAKVERQKGNRISKMEIWHRFPKFVLGFIAASIIFSAIYSSIGSDLGYVLIDNGAIRGFSKIFRGWFFCLAFVSIGLATDFRKLKSYFKGGKPLILYVCGQSFNLLLTLLMAYLMFYIIFPEITARI